MNEMVYIKLGKIAVGDKYLLVDGPDAIRVTEVLELGKIDENWYLPIPDGATEGTRMVIFHEVGEGVQYSTVDDYVKKAVKI